MKGGTAQQRRVAHEYNFTDSVRQPDSKSRVVTRRQLWLAGPRSNVSKSCIRTQQCKLIRSMHRSPPLPRCHVHSRLPAQQQRPHTGIPSTARTASQTDRQTDSNEQAQQRNNNDATTTQQRRNNATATQRHSACVSNAVMRSVSSEQCEWRVAERRTPTQRPK